MGTVGKVCDEPVWNFTATGGSNIDTGDAIELHPKTRNRSVFAMHILHWERPTTYSAQGRSFRILNRRRSIDFKFSSTGSN